MKFIESIEEFFEAKYLKNYQKERSILIWMAATAAVSGAFFGFVLGRVLLEKGFPLEIRLMFTLAGSLIAGLFLTYHHKYVRFLILTLTGISIVMPVLYLIYRSGIF